MFYRLRAGLLNPYRPYLRLGTPSWEAAGFEGLLRRLPGYGGSEPPLRRFRDSVGDRFFFGVGGRERLAAVLGSERVAGCRREADQALEHVFDLLGSGPVRLPGRIPWSRDFKSGREWPPAAHGEIVIQHGDGSDIKVVWELSRGYQLVALGKAYWLTGDERYRDEFQAQVSDWIERNPVGRGPNWACAMEVAIRAVNWICCYYLFGGETKERQEWWGPMLATLLNHALFLCRNLEVRRDRRGRVINNNHFLADICGLVFLGVFFQDLPVGRQWLGMAVRHFFQEVLAQLHRDGCDFEASTGYHALVTEMIAATVLLLGRNGMAVPAKVRQRLFAAFRFINSYTRPDGLAPQIGDQDDGRFLALGELFGAERNDHRYLLDVGRLIFGVAFERAAPRPSAYALWLGGGAAGGGRYGGGLAVAGRADTEGAVFPAGGYHLMRWNGHYGLVTVGRVGTRGTGNHTHNHAFSVEMAFHGSPVVVDPGSYVYTADPEARNLFRSTFYHNVLQVGKAEINRVPAGSVFGMREEARPRVKCWRAGPGWCRFEGEHRGFKSLGDGIRERRTIRFWGQSGCWLIVDRVEGGKRQRRQPREVQQLFHLHPDVRGFAGSEAGAEARRSPLGSLAAALGEGRGRLLWDSAVVLAAPSGRICLLPAGECGPEALVEPAWVSPAYGVRRPAEMVLFRCWRALPVVMAVLVFPLEARAGGGFQRQLAGELRRLRA